jgi:hypothetical protein
MRTRRAGRHHRSEIPTHLSCVAGICLDAAFRRKRDIPQLAARWLVAHGSERCVGLGCSTGL